jgi:NADH dehydrogenase (ubiquinone) Fe-S protein 6
MLYNLKELTRLHISSQANEHHRAHLESLPSTSYPLKAQGDIEEIPETQRITAEALGHR